MNATDSLRLSCPKCAATVRAPAALAGKRVKCPKCGGAIKVPGSVQTAGDDDDWLSLDDPLPKSVSGRPAAGDANRSAVPDLAIPALATPPRVAPGRGPAAAPRSSEPTAGSGGETDWFDDLPPVSSGPATSTTPKGPAEGGGLPPLSAAERAALAAAGGFDSGPSRTGKPGAGKPGAGKPGAGERDSDRLGRPPAALAGGDAVTEYRAKCPVCASVLFVRPQQAGREIRCSDCHSQFVVPAPPPPPVAKRKMDLDRAATFQLSEPAGIRDPHGAPGSKSAAEYLRAAEDEEGEEELPSNYDNPDVRAWLRGIFGIFTDPSVTAYWLMLSMLGAIPGMLAVAIGHPVVMIASLALLVVYGSLVVACGFAILETVAGGERRVNEWPVFNPAEWIGQCLTAIAAIAISAIPGMLLGYPLFGLGLGSVATVMFTVYLFFPYVLLSMLDNDTVFMPVSSEVSKSVTRCKEAWGVLYFSAMLLFFFQFVATAMLSLMPTMAAVFFNCLLWVALIFVYFSMIGQLAFAIGQPISDGPDVE